MDDVNQCSTSAKFYSPIRAVPLILVQETFHLLVLFIDQRDISYASAKHLFAIWSIFVNLI